MLTNWLLTLKAVRTVEISMVTHNMQSRSAKLHHTGYKINTYLQHKHHIKGC